MDATAVVDDVGDAVDVVLLLLMLELLFFMLLLVIMMIVPLIKLNVSLPSYKKTF